VTVEQEPVVTQDVDHVAEPEQEVEVVEVQESEIVSDHETFALAEQFRVELIDALGAVRIETAFGDMPRYFYMDHDPDVSMVYCTDVEDWRLYGMNYILNGDSVVIDFESKKRMKYAIVEFDEGEQTAMFSAVYQIIEQNYQANQQQWSEKYQAASDTIAEMQSEIEVLRQFKADTEETAIRTAAIAAQNEVFDRFQQLEGVDAFEALRADCSVNPGVHAVEDIEERCYAILGRTGLAAKFSAQETQLPKTKVDVNTEINEPYHGAFRHFGIGNN
jgi:hypothetical protein